MPLTKKKEVKAHGGTVIQYQHLSVSTKTEMVFSVFLPSVSSTKNVPSIYYLSGLTCNDQNFITKATPFAIANTYGVAIIAPDTSPRGAGIEGEDDSWDFGTGAGFYVDATEDPWKNNYNMYTYVTQELPALVEKELPITSTKSICGHSMGGHGALICYLKNPGMYESCSAFAPICNPIQCPWGEKAFNGYLGTNKQTWEAYDATCLVGNYKGEKYEILIDQGTKDGFLKKKQLLPENFVQACKAANFPVTLRMQEGYDHSYFFIRSFIGSHIKHHAGALDRAYNRSLHVSMDNATYGSVDTGTLGATKKVNYGSVDTGTLDVTKKVTYGAVALEQKASQFSNYLPDMAPLNVPVKRRTQTLTLVIWSLLPWFCIFLSLWLIRSGWLLTTLFLIYVTWMLTIQEFHVNGGHRLQWFRKSIFWRQFRDYFPISLIRTVKLDRQKNYLFGYHPHGIIAMGALCNFATEATDFEGKFPGINMRLLTLRSNFRIPFYSLFLTSLGLCDASRESLNNILSKGPGHSAMLVLGGAKESLDAHPGTFNLTLKNRKGFVKVAIENGASLVPVFSFGENDVFEQVSNPRGSRLRNIQVLLQKRLGFALPLIKGRGIFNYSYGLLPHRKPIITIVGTPIDVPKLPKDKITPDMINEYHAKYMDGLRAVWDANKDKYAHDRKGSLIYVDH